MNRKEFQHKIRETGRYETAADYRPARPHGALGRFDAWFYLCVTRIVLRAARMARRGRFDREAFADSSFSTLRLAENCGAHIEISDAARLAGDEPFVIMANHMSMFETFTLPAVLLAFRELSTVVKASLLRYPLFGVIMRASNPVAVTRKDPKEDLKSALIGGTQQLAEGRHVLVFPQATRSTVLRPSQMNTLAAKLARRAGVRLLPLALKTDFQGIGRLVRDFGRLDRNKPVHFAFGEPLSVTGNGKAAHEAALAFIIRKLENWDAQIEET